MSQKPEKSGTNTATNALETTPKPGTVRGLKPKSSASTPKTSSGAIPKATSSATASKSDSETSSTLPKATIISKSPTKPVVSPKKNTSTSKIQSKTTPRLEGSGQKASSIPKATSSASTPRPRIPGSQPSKLPRGPPKSVTPKQEVQKTDSPSKGSPKVIVSDPSGEVVGVLDSDSDPDILISPPKSPMKTLLCPPDLVQVDSGHSGSGSDDGSPLHFVNVFGEIRAWFGPNVETPGLVHRPAAYINGRLTGEDLPHHTDIIHGTWNKVYRWPPAKETLPRPREITFTPASKMESVLYTCICKESNLDYMAPVKVIPEESHNHVYTCQMVDREENVSAALLVDNCGCRAFPLTKKFVFLPINEHYVLHYEIVIGEEYSQANPNTVHLLYRGIPSTTEMDYMLKGLQVAKRLGAATFMAKYEELM